MKNKFHFIDHTGDVGVVVFGNSLKELFINAAESLFHILTELENIQEIKSKKVSLQAYSLEELIVDWLNEFIFLFDTQSLLFRRFEIEKLNNCSLEATVWGEEYEEGRHPIKTLVKAVTFHQLEIKEENGNWKAQIIFDL